MGMAKAFGLFPTIYQEYNKKQVDSKYLFLIDIMVSYINNKCTYSTYLYTHISANSHSQDSFSTFDNYHSIYIHSTQHTLSLSSFTKLSFKSIYLFRRLYFHFYNYYSIKLHSFNITYSLSSITKLSFKSIYLFTRLYFHSYNYHSIYIHST